jgi:8-oxo-dGTP pyrophosphatase MutT (NUDIX family)
MSQFCNNCGKIGHLFHQCKNPITSIGIIVFNNDEDNNLKYLMIRRKDSLGYVDFMRGKYPTTNKRYIENIISEMTNHEKSKLLNNTFLELWNELWGDYVGLQYRSEEKISSEKFELIKNGIIQSNKPFNLKSLIENSNTFWETPEWGFAKGRRNYQEKDLACALREFEEETGYDKNSLQLIQNILPIEEIFTGSNYKSYKHKYYLAYLPNNIEPIKSYQKSEVSKLGWFTIEECLNIIRPYNLEKKDILNRVHNILKKYDIIKI